MPAVWRLLKKRFATSAFDGEGPRLYGGRWNSRGTRVAYASGTIALAVLEVLVHLRSTPTGYVLMSAEVPDDLIQTLSAGALPKNWKQFPPPPEAAAVGDKWVKAGTAAVLTVPSAIIESERNYLLNPEHADFRRIKIGTPQPFVLDPRLAKTG